MAVPEEVDIISFWKPNMTINVVDDYTRFDSERHVPPQLRGGMPGRRSFVCVLRRRWCTREQKKRSGCGERERVHVPSMPCLYPHALLQTNAACPRRLALLAPTEIPRSSFGIWCLVAAALLYNEQRNGYYPSVYMNDFWLLSDKLVPVNASVPALNLTIALAPMSLMKWQMQVQVRVPCPFPRCRSEAKAGGAGRSATRSVTPGEPPGCKALPMRRPASRW